MKVYLQQLDAPQSRRVQQGQVYRVHLSERELKALQDTFRVKDQV